MTKEPRSRNALSLALKLIAVIAAAVVAYSGMEFSAVLKPEAGYLFPFSYLPGDTVSLYSDATITHKKTKIPIHSCDGEVINQFSARAVTSSLRRDYYPDGVSFPKNLVPLPSSLPSSLYSIADTIPFIVRPSGPKPILAVYPLLTRVAHSSWNTRNFISSIPADTLSLLTPVMRQEPERDFACWLKDNFPESGFITDTDLPHTDMSATRLLIFPGNLAYATREMTTVIHNALNRGINLLIIADKFLEYQVRLNENNQMLYYDHPHRDPETDTTLKAIRRYYIKTPLSYLNDLSLFKGGVANDSSRLQALKKFPWGDAVPELEIGRSAWLGYSTNDSTINTTLYGRIPVKYEGYDRHGIIAEINFNQNRGKIFVLGSSAFLQQLHEREIQQMLTNTVTYLSR